MCWACCRKGYPFQGPQVGSCVTRGNELSEETLMLTKQEVTGKGHLGGEQEGEGSQDCSALGLSLWFYGDGISFHVVFGRSF